VARRNSRANAVRVRERGRATQEELVVALKGLLMASVDVLRAAGEVEMIDRDWIDANVRFPTKRKNSNGHAG
jgi:hypothetical protein